MWTILNVLSMQEEKWRLLKSCLIEETQNGKIFNFCLSLEKWRLFKKIWTSAFVFFSYFENFCLCFFFSYFFHLNISLSLSLSLLFFLFPRINVLCSDGSLFWKRILGHFFTFWVRLLVILDASSGFTQMIRW